MKTIYAILLTFLVRGAFAAVPSVSVELTDVTVGALIPVVFGEVLQKPYVIDAALPLDGKVTLVMKQVAPATLERVALELLKSVQVEATTIGSIVRFRKQDPGAGESLHTYFPKFRSVDYLLGAVQAFFPSGAFGGQRDALQNVPLDVVSGGSGSSAQVPSDVAHSGLNQTMRQDRDVILFKGQNHDWNRLEKLLTELDIDVPQVLVSASVYEVQTGHKNGSALDLIGAVLGSKLGVNINGGASGGDSISIKLGGLEGVFAALSSDSRFKVLASPKVRVVSGKSARFSVGSEVPTLGSVSYDQNGKAVQSVAYKPAGVIFDIAPRVIGGRVEVGVGQQLSEFVETKNGVNNSPTLIKRELKTDVSLTDDEMVIVAGLDQQRETKSEGGLSFLPRFMRSASDDANNTEIVILLRVQRLDRGVQQNAL